MVTEDPSERGKFTLADEAPVQHIRLQGAAGPAAQAWSTGTESEKPHMPNACTLVLRSPGASKVKAAALVPTVALTVTQYWPYWELKLVSASM